MKNAILTVFFIAVGVVFFAPSVSYAGVVVDQDIHSASQTFTNDASHVYYQSLGLFTTTVGSVDFYFKQDSGGTRNFTVRGCDNSDYLTTGTCTNMVDWFSTNQTVVNSTKTLYNLVGTTQTFTSKSLYAGILSCGGTSVCTVYGSSSDVIAGEFVIYVTGTETIADLYVVIYDQYGSPINGTDPYVDYTNPVNHENKTDGNFNITYTVYDPNSDLPNSAELWLFKNNGNNAQTIYLESVALTGTGPWSKGLAVDLENGIYELVVTPSSTTTVETWPSNGIQFSVGSSTFQDSFEDLYSNLFASSTQATCASPSNILDVSGGIKYACFVE